MLGQCHLRVTNPPPISIPAPYLESYSSQVRATSGCRFCSESQEEDSARSRLSQGQVGAKGYQHKREGRLLRPIGQPAAVPWCQKLPCGWNTVQRTLEESIFVQIIQKQLFLLAITFCLQGTKNGVRCSCIVNSLLNNQASAPLKPETKIRILWFYPHAKQKNLN